MAPTTVSSSHLQLPPDSRQGREADGGAAVAKHGVLGLMRGVQPNLRRQGVAVRVNTVNPSWTATGIVPAGLLEAIGARAQAPEAVARSVGLLMADTARDGQALYSVEGRVYEVEQAVLLPAAAEGIVGVGRMGEDEAFGRMAEKAAAAGLVS